MLDELERAECEKQAADIVAEISKALDAGAGDRVRAEAAYFRKALRALTLRAEG